MAEASVLAVGPTFVGAGASPSFPVSATAVTSHVTVEDPGHGLPGTLFPTGFKGVETAVLLLVTYDSCRQSCSFPQSDNDRWDDDDLLNTSRKSPQSHE